MSESITRGLRGLLVWLTTTFLAVGGGVWVAPDVRAGARALTGGAFLDVLLGACALVVAGCAAWWWLVTTLVLVESARAASPVPSWAVPAWARRAVVAACGLAVVAAAAPAGAISADVLLDHGGRHAAPLAGLPLPDRATGGELPRQPRTPTTAARRPVATDDVVVRPGDSLWNICARRIGPGASADRVAAATRAVYRANGAVIGADPDLIHPGQHLRVLLPQESPDR